MRIWLILSCVFNLSTSAIAANMSEHGIPPNRDAGFAVVRSGSGGTALNTGLNTISHATLPCVTGTNYCKFGISAMVIVINGGSTNPWSICAVVDGRAAEPPCSAQPDVPTAQPVTGTSLQILRVQYGSHDVALQVYVSGPTTLGGWSVVYQAYPN